jgi:hypothetical protein
MAKRTPQSQADDTSAAPSRPQPKTARERSRTPARGGDTGVRETEGRQSAPPSDTFAGRAEESGQTPDASPEDNRSTSMGSEPTDEEIRLRAYHRYLERGGGHGMDFEDWLEAEKELRGKRGR